MNKLEFEEYYTKCKAIWEYYGKEAQLNQLVEECAELIRAIVKKDRANILEELADVQVLIDQLSIAYPEFDDCIDPLKVHKVDRQLKRIGIEVVKNNWGIMTKFTIEPNAYEAISGIDLINDLLFQLELTDEEKKRLNSLRIDNLPRILPKENNKQKVVICVNDKRIFSSFAECAKFYGITKQAVENSIKYQQNVKGFLFRKIQE